MVQKQIWIWVITNVSYVKGKMTKLNNFTSGRVYQDVLNKERRGMIVGWYSSGYSSITDNIKRTAGTPRGRRLP